MRSMGKKTLHFDGQRLKMTKCCVFVILQIESSPYDSKKIELVTIKGKPFCREVMCLCSGCFHYILIMDLFFEEHRRDVMKIIFWNLLE